MYGLLTGKGDIWLFKVLFRLVKIGVVAGIAGFVLIQFIPYGRSHNDPPATNPVTWDSPQTKQLAMEACGDCHSNQTTWPWYSNIAPMSWLVQEHVDHGRQILNFSNFSPNQRGADRAARAVQNGSMPPGYYTLIHGTARLTDAQKQQLIQGLIATFGSQRGSASP
ncbi:MAG: heme-binding domain-containing protein [Nitrolancea sp.]